MLIMCKSCKKLVDTNKHDFCPRCGSNFNYGENLKAVNNTADYEEYEHRMEEQQRAAVENRINNPKELTAKETQKRLKKQEDKAQGKKNGCIGCFAVVLFLAVAFGTILSDEDIDLDELFADDYEAAVSVTVPEDDIYTEFVPDEYDDYTYTQFILPGGTAYTENYTFSCTGVAEYENEFFKPDEGCKYISFTFKLENITDTTRFYYDSPVCMADGEEAAMAAFGGLFIPGQLEPGEVYEGTVVFQMPEHALFYDIYYGDDVVVYASISDIEGYEDYWGQE